MKKQLLQETDIRKMMKFANIGALSDGFVTRLSETYMEGEEDLVEQEEEEEEEVPLGDEPAMDEPAMDEPAMDEPAMDEPAMDDVGPADAAVEGVEQLFDGLTATFEKIAAMGGEGAEIAQQVLDRVSMSKTADAGAEGLDEPEALDLGPEAAPEAAPEDDFAAADAEVVDDEDVMNEVARRVAKRLLRIKRRK